MADFTDTYRRTVLDNGVRIVTERLPNIRSLALGIWFDTGSRDEPDDLAGISHFLEHMNFKGTPKRSAAAIARQIEGRGGHLNAFTSKEITCFHARVVDQQIVNAVDVLSDITLNSVMDSAELKRERDVILEELKSVEDTPDELAFEYFLQQLYHNHPMGRSVLGNRDSLASITSSKMRKYRDDHFAGSRVVISAAGNVNHDRLVGLIERRFSNVKDAVRNRPEIIEKNTASLRQDIHTATQQAHIIIGCRSINYSHRDKYVMLVLNTLLGGGMSSRLFQRVRERNGLAYSVFSFIETYGDTGVFGVYAGTDPEKGEKAIKLINQELKILTKKAVSNRELKRTKDQLKGNLLMGLESPSARMNRLAKMEIYTHDWTHIDEVVRRIDEVTSTDIQRVAGETFNYNSLYTTVLLPN